MKTIDELINNIWPQHHKGQINKALDEHEQHYGLHHTEHDILKGIGQ